jgi:hypothetical protein
MDSDLQQAVLVPVLLVLAVLVTELHIKQSIIWITHNWYPITKLQQCIHVFFYIGFLAVYTNSYPCLWETSLQDMGSQFSPAQELVPGAAKGLDNPELTLITNHRVRQVLSSFIADC